MRTPRTAAVKDGRRSNATMSFALDRPRLDGCEHGVSLNRDPAIHRAQSECLMVAASGHRHCEERSDEAIHLSACGTMDCFRLRQGFGGHVASRAMTNNLQLPQQRI